MEHAVIISLDEKFDPIYSCPAMQCEERAISKAQRRVHAAEIATRVLKARLSLLRARAHLASARRDGNETRLSELSFVRSLEAVWAAQQELAVIDGTWKCDQCTTTIPHHHLAPSFVMRPSKASRWNACNGYDK
jgi:hypothetical protein